VVQSVAGMVQKGEKVVQFTDKEVQKSEKIIQSCAKTKVCSTYTLSVGDERPY
jgi:hypothetical protein